MLNNSSLPLHQLNESPIFVTGQQNETLAEDQIQHLKHVIRLMWGIVSPILFLAGVFGNVICLLVLRRMHFWKKPALFFLVPLAVTDMVVLSTGLSRYWALYVFDYDLRLVSNTGCKVNLFVIYISMQYSSWILVCFTGERFFKTRYPLRYIRCFTVRRQVATICVIFFFLTLIDGHYFFTNGIKLSNDSSSYTYYCDSLSESISKFENEIFTYVDLAVLCIVPIVILVTFNVFIVSALKKSENFRQTSVLRENALVRTASRPFSVSVTRMLLFSNTYFLVCTLPISVYFIFDTYTSDWTGVKEKHKELALSILYLLQFSNYSANFFIYVLVNGSFRKQLKEMLKWKITRRAEQNNGSHSLSTELHTHEIINAKNALSFAESL